MIESSYRLMLVDEDPVFRMGLRIWLEQSAGFQVIAEAEQGTDALALLEARCRISDGLEDTQALVPDLDLVILDLGLGLGDPDQIAGLQLCRTIKQQYPTLPVLVLSAQLEPVIQAAARQVGADGYGLRGMPVKDLALLIEQTIAPFNPAAEFPITSPGEPSPISVPGPWTAMRVGLRLSSLQQIEAELKQVEAQRRRGTGSLWADTVLDGRYRELKAARWLIQRLLATPRFSDRLEPIPPTSTAAATPSSRAQLDPVGPPSASMPPSSGEVPVDDRLPPSPPRIPQVVGIPRSSALTQADRLSLQRGDVLSVVLEQVFRKFQGNLENISEIPLETDILRQDKKRELLYLALRKLEDVLMDLKQSEIQPGRVQNYAARILRDVWEAVTIDFFGRYYTLQTAVSDASLPPDDGNTPSASRDTTAPADIRIGETLQQPIVPALLTEADVVQQQILDQIPLVPMLLGHVLFQDAILVEGSPYLATTPEALTRSRELMENLLLQIANGVMQPLLNQFSDVEPLKKAFYNRRVMPTREIERFRNNLSWRYRWDMWVDNPKAIFESQYRLFVFTERGIQTRFIYAPRREELDRLTGLQRSVTLALEARDAVAPRLRSTLSFFGSGIVYLLTDVLGRGIGLIGRGILKGIGSAWKDPRYQRNGKDDS